MSLKALALPTVCKIKCSRPKGPISSGLKVIRLPIIGFDPEKFPLLVSNNFFTYCRLIICRLHRPQNPYAGLLLFFFRFVIYLPQNRRNIFLSGFKGSHAKACLNFLVTNFKHKSKSNEFAESCYYRNLNFDVFSLQNCTFNP
jgi:hypothetical protein